MDFLQDQDRGDKQQSIDGIEEHITHAWGVRGGVGEEICNRAADIRPDRTCACAGQVREAQVSPGFRIGTRSVPSAQLDV